MKHCIQSSVAHSPAMICGDAIHFRKMSGVSKAESRCQVCWCCWASFQELIICVMRNVEPNFIDLENDMHANKHTLEMVHTIALCAYCFLTVLRRRAALFPAQQWISSRLPARRSVTKPTWIRHITHNPNFEWWATYNLDWIDIQNTSIFI